MTTPPRPAPAHVPTLTEVIEFDPVPMPQEEAWPEAAAAAPAVQAPVPVDAGDTIPQPDAVGAPPLQPLSADASVLPATTSPLADSGVVLPAPSVPFLPPLPASTPSTPSTPAAPAALAAPASQQASSPSPAPPRGPDGAASIDEAQLAQRVLADVQRQIDGMLEYRLRQALTPILARTAEALVRELRQDLSKTMRDVVSRAVAQEIARQRPRS